MIDGRRKSFRPTAEELVLLQLCSKDVEVEVFASRGAISAYSVAVEVRDTTAASPGERGPRGAPRISALRAGAYN